MSASLARLTFDRVRAPVQSVLALDCGHRRLKLLLAESDFGRLRIVRQEMLDLQAEGLVSADELKTHLQGTLEEWGNPPLALVLPQHLSISQLVDLPQAPDSEVDQLIAEETLKLGGVSNSRIVYDFVPAETAAKGRQQFWVTLCQEGDIRERLSRLGVDHEEICEVTTTDNALIAAYRATCPHSPRAILVHLGAQTTVVVILVAGQGAFATSFQMGGDFFTRSLARLRNCPEETAEALKREKDLLSGPEASAEFKAVVDGWVAELKRQLSEWFQQNPAVSREAPSFDLIASGGGFEQTGLREYLKTSADLPFQPWPAATGANTVAPGKDFEVAYGAALQALGQTAQTISLLPDDYRLAWKKRLSRQRIDLASLVLACLCGVVLIFGTWHKISLLNRQSALLQKVQAAQRAVEENDGLTASLLGEYENLRPVLAAQQHTVDTLKTLALLQQSRAQGNLWYVLLADQQSYFSQPPALLLTNRPARTNLLGAAVDPTRGGVLSFRSPAAALTNVLPGKPGFIAELCVPGEAEAARRVISVVVNSLKQEPLFSKVDLLSDDLRRNLADPKVIVPDREFVLALDFSCTDFEQPIPPKKLVPGSRPKRSARPPWTAPESGDTANQSAP